MEEVPKEKKPRTEKQLKAFEKARNVLLEKRKVKIEQELNSGGDLVKPKPEKKQKEVTKVIEKIPEVPKIEPPKKVKIEKEPESDTDEEVEPVQQIIYKKKPKPKVVYVTDSEEDETPPPKKIIKKSIQAPPSTPAPIKKVNPYTSMLNNSSRF